MNEEIMHHINCKKGDVGRYVLLPGDPDRCEIIAKYLDNPQKITQKREYNVYTGFLEGVKVSVVSTGIGGPSASIAMEELSMIGADTFVRVGTAGGMQLDVVAGDLVIPSGAIRIDGTSKEYMPIEFPAVPNYELTGALIDACKKYNHTYHIGIVECKDSFYGQHNPERMPIANELLNRWDAWLKGGTLASEMESSTLFVVASVLKVRMATVLHIANNQERIKNNLENVRTGDVTKAVITAIEALKMIINKDKSL